MAVTRMGDPVPVNTPLERGYIMKRFGLLLFALSCSACTTSLRVTEFNPAVPRTRVGMPYPLGFTQYRITLTRQVVGCGSRMVVTAGAKIEEARNAPDPLRRYVIDPDSLSSPVKTSEVKLEYQPNGLVSTLNATAVDKTGDLIANIGSIAVKVASLAVAPGGPADACKDEVIDALAKIAQQKPIVAAAGDDLEQSLARLKAAKDKAADMGAAVDEGTKKELSSAFDALAVAAARQKAESGKLEALMAKVTDTQTVHWPDNGDVGRGIFRMDSSVLSRWARTLSSDPLQQRERSKLDIFVQIRAVTGGARPLTLVSPDETAGGPSAPGSGPERIDPSFGIPFRQPDYGEIRICNVAFCDHGGELLAEQRGNLMQLGQIYYLPCRSQAFSSIKCAFEFTADGWLKSMGSTRSEAVLVNATAAVKGALDNVATIQSTLAGADTAALEAKTKALKAQADYAAAVAALAPSPNASTQAETAGLTAQIELARARKDLIEAEDQLNAARSRGSQGGGLQ